MNRCNRSEAGIFCKAAIAELCGLTVKIQFFRLIGLVLIAAIDGDIRLNYGYFGLGNCPEIENLSR